MTPDHTDSARDQDAQCTCNWQPAPDGPEWDPHCPMHGVHAPTRDGDPGLDIDTSYAREEATA